MRIYANDSKSADYVGIVKSVSNVYRKSVLNNALLSSKLNSVKVFINMVDAGATAGFMAEGVTADGKKPLYSIQLFVNPEDDQQVVTFIFAHEFAHLFFENNLDALKMAARMSGAKYLVETSFQMMNPKGRIYGRNLEEYAADYVARYVVAKLFKGQYSAEYEAFLKSKAFRFEVIENYAACFGETLDVCEHIDEYRKDKVAGGYRIDIGNVLWYSVPTMSTQEVVSKFNKALKNDNAYAEFSDMIDGYERTRDENGRIKIRNFLDFANRSMVCHSAQSR